MKDPMTPEVLTRLWQRQIGPLIEEYFFDQADVMQSFDPASYWPELQD